MRGSIRGLAGYFPFTVLLIAGVAGWLAYNGNYANLDANRVVLAQVLNPFYYAESLLLHTDWGHYRRNMTVLGFVPVGIVMTYLTSNRHVLGVVVVSQSLAALVYGLGMWRLVYGSSVAAFGLLGATVVRGAGIAGRESSSTALGIGLIGLMVPFGAALLLIGILDASSQIAHFTHLLGFSFGGAYEAIYVFSGRNQGERGRNGGYTPRHA